ncbi:hypothetical protein PIB30_094241, partial [Stylosanthes scabra]|nr:hypothetical protein [Stylosanthes scabra]
LIRTNTLLHKTSASFDTTILELQFRRHHTRTPVRRRLLCSSLPSHLPYLLSVTELVAALSSHCRLLLMSFTSLALFLSLVSLKMCSNFTIKKDHERFFWKAYKYMTSKRLSQMLWDVRNGIDKEHEWILPTHKKTKELGRIPTHEEVFNELHTRKGDKSKWVDKRSQDTHNRFKERLAELQAQHAEAQAQGIDLPPIDEDAVWEEVCGDTKKNRVYDKGAFFSESDFRFATGRPSSPDQTSGLQEEINKLNKEIHRVTQQTDERIIKLLDTRLAPLEKSSKKLEKFQRAAEKAKKARLKQKEWNEAYANYYKKIKASNSSNAIPPPPPPMESDEEYDDEDEDDTEDYS